MSTSNDELSFQIVATLRSIAQEIDTYSRELWVKFGVTAPQIGVLRFLSARPEATVTAVCGELRVTQQTMAGILQRLESRGLVTRKKDTADRRKVILTLTADGERFSQSLPHLLRDQFMERLTQLSTSRRQALLDSLQELSTMLDVDAPQYLPFLFTEPSESATQAVQAPPDTHKSRSGIEQQLDPTKFVRMSKHSEIY